MGFAGKSAGVKVTLRVASSFEEADAIDARDLARLDSIARLSAVERLRRIWFGEARTESRLERVLRCLDFAEREVPAVAESRRCLRRSTSSPVDSGSHHRPLAVFRWSRAHADQT